MFSAYRALIAHVTSNHDGHYHDQEQQLNNYQWSYLSNADTLATEDTLKAEFGHVSTKLLHGLNRANRFALDGVGLHDNLLIK